MLGSVFSLLVMFILSVYALRNFVDQEPRINAESGEALNSSSAIPDFAITLATLASKGKILEHIWPEFVWVNVSDGFTNQTKMKRFEGGVKFGQECNLSVGYDSRSDKGLGSSQWPVFCLTDSDQKLQGRFGDPLWRYLQVRLYRCNSSDWDGTLKSTPQLTKDLQGQWSGKCASPEEIDRFVKGLAANIWLRLENKGFQAERGERAIDAATRVQVTKT